MADRDLIDAVHEALHQALVQPALDEVAALGEADRLCHALQARLGGHRYYLPRPDKHPRNLRIAADLHAGRTAQAVAVQHGVSPKTVTRVTRAVSGETDQAGFGGPEWEIK